MLAFLIGVLSSKDACGVPPLTSPYMLYFAEERQHSAMHGYHRRQSRERGSDDPHCVWVIIVSGSSSGGLHFLIVSRALQTHLEAASPTFRSVRQFKLDRHSSCYPVVRVEPCRSGV